MGDTWCYAFAKTNRTSHHKELTLIHANFRNLRGQDEMQNVTK